MAQTTLVGTAFRLPFKADLTWGHRAWNANAEHKAEYGGHGKTDQDKNESKGTTWQNLRPQKVRMAHAMALGLINPKVNIPATFARTAANQYADLLVLSRECENGPRHPLKERHNTTRDGIYKGHFFIPCRAPASRQDSWVATVNMLICEAPYSDLILAGWVAIISISCLTCWTTSIFHVCILASCPVCGRKRP